MVGGDLFRGQRIDALLKGGKPVIRFAASRDRDLHLGGADSGDIHTDAFGHEPEGIAGIAEGVGGRIVAAYREAGWKHLVDQNATAAQSASPEKPLTDLWLHFRGADIDAVTVVVRGRKQMSVIEVSGSLKPLDLVHLSGHFGIPKVDSGAVMVPAPPGK